MKRIAIVLIALPALSAALLAAELDASKPGNYTSENWGYRYTISGAGTDAEQRAGVLQFDGKAVTGAAVSDRVQTPWGVMQYFGEKPGPNRGWLTRAAGDKPVDETKGRLLDDPEAWVPLVADRAGKLRTELGDLVVGLRYYGPGEKSYCRIYVSTIIWRVSKEDPMVLHSLLDHAAATKVVDRLTTSGFLAHAEPSAIPAKAPAGPCYVLSAGAGSLRLEENLGWNASTAARLADFREALSGDAAKKMDQLLAKLSGVMKKWAAAETKPPH